MGGGGSHSTQGPPSYRVWRGEGEARAPALALHTIKCMQVSLSPISVLLRQPLSIKKSYAGAVHRIRAARIRIQIDLFRIRPRIRINNTAQNIMNYFFLNFGENSIFNCQTGTAKFTIFFLIFYLFMYCIGTMTGPALPLCLVGLGGSCAACASACIASSGFPIWKMFQQYVCYLFCQYTHCNIFGWWLFFWNFMQLCNPIYSGPPTKIYKRN